MTYTPSNAFNSIKYYPGTAIPVSSGRSYTSFIYPDNTPTAEPIPQVDSKTPLVGYRAWKVTQSAGKYYLQSTYKTTLWPHREKLVRGEKPKQAYMDPNLSDYALYTSIVDPNDDFSLGIHAVKEKHKLAGICVEYESCRIGGEVYLWGDVTETAHGYLAQYAYPKQLFVMSDMDPTVVMELEDNYGVPVLVSEALEECYKLECELRAEKQRLDGLKMKYDFMQYATLSPSQQAVMFAPSVANPAGINPYAGMMNASAAAMSALLPPSTPAPEVPETTKNLKKKGIRRWAWWMK
jgi:hypothetical protein